MTNKDKIFKALNDSLEILAEDNYVFSGEIMTNDIIKIVVDAKPKNREAFANLVDFDEDMMDRYGDALWASISKLVRK